MPPPPPPPPGAPPPPAPPALPKLGGAAGGVERKDLLKDIRSGARLKPTKTNDRSAPIVGSGKSASTASGPPSNDRSGGGSGNGDSRTDAQSSQFTGPLPGIGGLFAGGMPTLKKTKGGINTGRAPDPESPHKSAANGSSSSNNINNKFLNSSTSSLVRKSNSSTNNNNNSFLHSYYFGENGDVAPALHAGAPYSDGQHDYHSSNNTYAKPVKHKSHTISRTNSRHSSSTSSHSNSVNNSSNLKSDNQIQNNISNNNNNHIKPISKPARTSMTSGRNYELMKTKSDDSIIEKPSPYSGGTLPRTPGRLQKTKSSTFISPDQQTESMFYKSKVTLTLRRSRTNLNEDFESSSSSPTMNGPKQTYYYGEGLPPSDRPAMPSCLPTERILRRAEELRSQCPTPPPLMSKPSLQKTNSSPSLSPSPSPVSSSTPVHSKPDVQRGIPQSPAIGLASSNLTNAIPTKPPPPSTKPNYTRPQNGGPVHPPNKPPPPPIGGGIKTNLGRNQTIGHGPQGRPQIPNYEKRRSRDDSSIGNGHVGGANGPPPPPPVRTVSQNQITNSSRVPTRAPPPPPPSHKRPSQPPPPPPGQANSQAPMQPPTKALPPPPPSVLQVGGDPPTPPTRRESIYRTGQTNNNATAANGAGFSAESFEFKFASRFKTLQFLPPPEPFSGCQKTYPSKQTLPVRQGSQIKRTPAPPPPPGGIPPPPVSHAPYPPGGVGGKSSMFDRPPLPSARQMSVTTTTGIL